MLGKTLSELVVVAAIVAITAGCGRDSYPADSTQAIDNTGISLLATTGMIGDIVRAVAREHARVEVLMGPGTDPHSYKAREKDVHALARADVIFSNGMHLEGRLHRVLEQLARRKAVVQVADAIPREHLRFTDENQPDPHIWFDVGIWSATIPTVVKALTQAMPDYADDFAKNGRRLTQKLVELDNYCRERIASIPKERRVLVTAHDAFGYLGRAYDMEIMSIQGLSSVDEAGVQDINTLVEKIVSRRIKAVFVESTLSSRNVEALVEGCRARGHDLQIGGELYSDALGALRGPTGTWEGVVRHNVETIANALR